MRLLWQFIVAVAQHWGSLVTGGIAIGMLGIWQGTGHHVSSSVYWGVALVGLFFAFYRAWLDEHNAKEALLHGVSGGRTSEWIQLSQEKRHLQDELGTLEVKMQFLAIIPIIKLGKDETDLLREKIARTTQAISEIEERMKGL